MAYFIPNQSKIEQKDVKPSLGREAIWELLSPIEREFMGELNKKFNIKFVKGVKNANI